MFAIEEVRHALDYALEETFGDLYKCTLPLVVMFAQREIRDPKRRLTTSSPRGGNLDQLSV